MTLPKKLEQQKGMEWLSACLESSQISHNSHQTDKFIFDMGFNSAVNLLIPEIEKLREALRTKCMCYPSDDPRSGRNPCHVCRTIQSLEEFLNGK